MKIRGKLSSGFLMIILVFTVLFLLFIFLNITINNLQQDKLTSLMILRSWDELVNLTSKLIVSDDFNTAKEQWKASSSYFNYKIKSFIELQISKISRNSDKQFYSKLLNLKELWENVKIELDEIEYLSESDKIKNISSMAISLLKRDSQLKVLNSPDPDLNSLVVKINNFETFSYYFINFLSGIIYHINDNVQAQIGSLNIIIFILYSSVIILTIIFSVIFSKKIAERIQTVERAVKNVSEGDFSTKLKIKTNDEFGILSGHFNEFMNDLKNRLDSELDFMINVSRAITDNPDFSTILKLISESAVKNTGASAGAIFFANGEKDELKIESSTGNFSELFPLNKIYLKNKENMAKIEKRLSSMANEIIKSGKPVFTNNKHDKDTINSLIAVPLSISNITAGILIIIKHHDNGVFTDLDYTHLRTFADYASLAIDNHFKYLEILDKQKLDREIKIAADIQLKLLPRKIPRFPNASISAFYKPAKGVSGDYFDIIRLRNNKVALVICDVAGKGIPAALVMVIIRTILHLISFSVNDTARILSWINRGINSIIDVERYATMSFVIYDHKKRTVTYSNAAHLPLILLNYGKRKVEIIDTRGLPIGIDKNSEYENKTFNLEKNDAMVLYTDGVLESFNSKGEQYSFNNLKNILKKTMHLTAKDIARNVYADVKKFMGKSKQHDDQTFLMLKAT